MEWDWDSIAKKTIAKGGLEDKKPKFIEPSLLIFNF